MKMPWEQALLPLEPDWEIPRLAEDPRELALRHVRALLARGYTEDLAAKDNWSGSGALHGVPGSDCEVKNGKIRVPLFGKSRYVFSFGELAREIRASTSSPEPTK